MRAIYLPEIQNNQSVGLTKEKVHHFINVLRIKDKEEVLLLDGVGGQYKAFVNIVSKKEIELSDISKTEVASIKSNIDLVIGTLKKDAMDLALKNAVELGVNKIFIAQTQYAQKNTLNKSRIKKIMISAMEQSNNSYLPEIVFLDFTAIDLLNYECVYVLTTELRQKIDKVFNGSSSLIVIGPEGGLGKKDYEHLDKFKNISYINLPCNILRAPNAVSCAMGYVWGALASKS